MRAWSRAAAFVSIAALLHATFALFPKKPRAREAPRVTHVGTEFRLIPVAIEAPKAPLGPPPGGGSKNPVPSSRTRAAPHRVSQHSLAQPKLPPSAVERALPAVSDRAPEVLTPPESTVEVPDLVTQASSHDSMKPAHRATATALRVAPERSALAPYEGTGPGSRTGPGGRGAGYGSGPGVLSTRFAFGGPSGAFRAEVCFIPETTNSLKDIRNCRTELTFFTDHLDIPPRSFSDGFPGITTRTEWFAIYYGGAFHVRAGDYFTFRLISDDGSLLYVDGYLIIDNDKRHPPASKQATIPLAAGKHLLSLEYYQGPRDRIALQLFVTGSDGLEKLFGPVI